LPVGIQVIGYAFEDEEVLAVMHNLEKKVGFEIST
jgi:Asp-tRNA(Asn)/Glu-tRNA(Gln) amidotransferase A subunit family amidase